MSGYGDAYHAVMLVPRPAMRPKMLSVVPALHRLVQSLVRLPAHPSSPLSNTNAGYEGKPPCQPFSPSGLFVHPAGYALFLSSLVSESLPGNRHKFVAECASVYQFSGARYLLFID